MKYFQTITLKDGRTCVIRNGMEQDAETVLSNYILTHSQTDFLTTYPEETTFTVDQEKEYLKKKADNDREIELVAEVDEKIIGTAGVDRIGTAEKIRHRASFGISIEEAFWGMGIGWALTNGCIECAGTAGYSQIELEVVSDNRRALALYQRAGYVEYGRNPQGFRSRKSGWQETVLMRRELDS